MDVHSLIPPESPYFYQGTGDPWNEDELQRAFALAMAVEVAGLEARYVSPWFGLSVSGGPGPIFQSSLSSIPYTPVHSGASIIKVTKVGLLNRKEDTIEGGRRAINRKWREWCVVLTGSQLLFLRDASWFGHLHQQGDPENGQVVVAQALLPQPDEILSVRDTVAVYDKSYNKVCSPQMLFTLHTNIGTCSIPIHYVSWYPTAASSSSRLLTRQR